MKYNSVLIAGDVTVVLIEQAVGPTEWTIEVSLNGRSVGAAALIRSYFPRISIGSDRFLLWGGTRLYWGAVKGSALRRVDVDDELHAAYHLESAWWCLFGETSVYLWNDFDGTISAAIHRELLVDTWREGRQLYVRDLQRRLFMVHVDLTLRSVNLRATEGATQE